MDKVLSEIKYDEKGLVPAIVQDVVSKDILMLAYMNQEALRKTIETKKTWFYSRSRKQLWNKGETSGNYQLVKRISYDCDKDALLILVEPLGNACHTGEKSCFFSILYKDSNEDESTEIISLLMERLKNRKKNPLEGSYTSYLFEKGLDKILKKISEEAGEVIISAKNENKFEMIYELSDLLYHSLVLMVEKEIDIVDIKSEMIKRYKK
ncbi:phosphoribosyl-ATP pyrophosphohydrolase/phosphoribosyl-AMP cyclohydrolase [Anaerosolibacter carboniphilus]|uniref:Histidine biosynthesis bifunctional protein HisIE n=1 Tax=Anaerosolibacter carboniphilus TaxID=1417629 RepID=A0A841KZU8_9FIRM|nr:bifunctional phosphoribosyl-AMP cyclohydrolase/phosphoribosyl-ATP diphosphatase HisIE [Anaerosolibacter carboniphilus]MBB6215669.1 phosphoribosyl-ATP pyrophosphohydrolase/phosphoribosyl-AMP cyclohydrolase [Anaerosolibacter carboniphilus]